MNALAVAIAAALVLPAALLAAALVVDRHRRRRPLGRHAVGVPVEAPPVVIRTRHHTDPAAVTIERDPTDPAYHPAELAAYTAARHAATLHELQAVRADLDRLDTLAGQLYTAAAAALVATDPASAGELHAAMLDLRGWWHR